MQRQLNIQKALCVCKSLLPTANMEATKTPFSRGKGKQTVVHPSNEHLVRKSNELPDHENTWRNCKCMLLREADHIL